MFSTIFYYLKAVQVNSAAAVAQAAIQSMAKKV